MRGLGPVSLVFVLALSVVVRAEESGGRLEKGTRLLATRWPLQEGCSRYESADLAVDDRVSSVEWHSPDWQPLSFDLAPLFKEESTDKYRLGSNGTDCHVGGTSCIVYRKPVGRLLHVRIARFTRALGLDFKSGGFDQLIVRADVERGVDGPYDFGLQLILHCADPAKPSLAWSCDAHACVLRSFRANVKMQELWKEEASKPLRERRYVPAGAGPYRAGWKRGTPPKDRTRVICMRGASGQAEVDREARRKNPALVCREKTPVAEARALLLQLGRDLLLDEDAVIAEGCAGTCSARVDELRAVGRAIAADANLRIAGIRAAFHDSHDEFGYGAYPSLGWVATLRAHAGTIEIACARRRTDTSVLPDREECRLSVSARGRRLADYTPDWGPSIIFPDGGGVEMLEPAPSSHPSSEPGDKIEIIGSALAQ